MKKCYLSLYFFLITVIFLPFRIFSCTSFADYSETPVYGYNFDYPDRSLRFRFYKGQGFDLLAFEMFEDGNWSRIGHFTADGIHTAMLLLYPQRVTVHKQSEKDVSVNSIGSWVYTLRTIDEILAHVNRVNLFESMPRIHRVFYGPDKAFACEASPNGNFISLSEPNGYLVTTNFELFKFDNLPPDKVHGPGEDRYRTAVQDIEKARNSTGMNGDAAMRILERTAASGGSYKTLCSMVFIPETLSLRVVFDRNFEKEFIVSLTEKTVTAKWEGATSVPVKIGGKGVTEELLLTWLNNDPSDDWMGGNENTFIVMILSGTATFLFVTVVICIYRTRKKISRNSKMVSQDNTL